MMLCPVCKDEACSASLVGILPSVQAALVRRAHPDSRAAAELRAALSCPYLHLAETKLAQGVSPEIVWPAVAQGLAEGTAQTAADMLTRLRPTTGMSASDAEACARSLSAALKGVQEAMRTVLERSPSRMLLVLLALVLSGCTVPARVGDGDLKDVLEAVRYTRDRHGNCLALLSSQTRDGYRVVSLTTVARGCD